MFWRQALRAREREAARQQEAWIDMQGTPRTLPPLALGTQYTVELEGSGRLTFRNRQHLRPVRGASPAPVGTISSPSQPGPRPAAKQDTVSRPARRVRQPAWMADYVPDMSSQ
ncbi:hypothetical protein O3P69_014837 [Scylla paramamosain]|uniref:Uncharacterized protein n=1 Tax=Scylla paramamosain TaxID=85552 RepID=A0AAW0TY45_SCYPA